MHGNTLVPAMEFCCFTHRPSLMNLKAVGQRSRLFPLWEDILRLNFLPLLFWTGFFYFKFYLKPLIFFSHPHPQTFTHELETVGQRSRLFTHWEHILRLNFLPLLFCAGFFYFKFSLNPLRFSSRETPKTSI